MASLPEPLKELPAADGAPFGATGAEARLRAAGVEPMAWSNGPGDRYAAHQHGYEKLLICATGSITFLIGPESTPVELSAGDGFALPAGTRHAAIVGPGGCTCVEAIGPEISPGVRGAGRDDLPSASGSGRSSGG